MNARDILIGWVRTDIQRILGKIANQDDVFGSEIHVDSGGVSFFIDVDGGDIDRAGNSELEVTLRLSEATAFGEPQACLDLGQGGLGDAAARLKEVGPSLLAVLSESAQERSDVWSLVALALKRASEGAMKS